ncbi:hypothetical protein [Proteiniphilum sp. X52]|uniref:hypothetical protein n=1 Tax=Proteiniphilum sp. X52 TaxID=2382159 RepID=UPI000F0A0770|nr:hypothetical protein [Proteiniphilum sp. X52]RNC63692.1 hypothetical protein D7D25_14875 [Proteiniphilum sp. X52]
MKQIQILITCSMLLGMIACQRQNINISEFKHQELFNIPKETENFIIANNEYEILKNEFSGFDSYIDYYIAHGNTYQTDYSSMSDNEAIRIACVEYLMSQKDFLLQLNSKQRKELLCLSMKKQKIKFDVKYSNPMMARQTGLQLITQLLSIEGEKEILQSISDYCSQHEFEYGIYNDKDFNDFLMQIISNHCNK